MQHELAFVEAGDGCIEFSDVHATVGTFHTFEQPGLVSFGLKPANHPCACVRDCLVVDVDRVLRGQHQTNTKGSGLLQNGKNRFLRWWHCRRRNETKHLVHVDQHPQVVAAWLAAHPGHDLGKNQRDDELAFLIGQMMDVHDRGAGVAIWLEQHGVDVERHALVPRSECRRGS